MIFFSKEGKREGEKTKIEEETEKLKNYKEEKSPPMPWSPKQTNPLPKSPYKSMKFYDQFQWTTTRTITTPISNPSRREGLD